MKVDKVNLSRFFFNMNFSFMNKIRRLILNIYILELQKLHKMVDDLHEENNILIIIILAYNNK